MWGLSGVDAAARVALIVPAGLGGNGEFERKFEEIWGKLRKFVGN